MGKKQHDNKQTMGEKTGAASAAAATAGGKGAGVGTGKLGKDVLAFLTSSEGQKEMSSSSAPVLFNATSERVAYLSGSLCGVDALKTLLVASAEEGNVLRWRLDMEVEPPHFSLDLPDGEVVTEEQVDELATAGAELVVLQPQRVHDGLWELVARMEAQLGCLVGCNTHITQHVKSSGSKQAREEKEKVEGDQESDEEGEEMDAGELGRVVVVAPTWLVQANGSTHVRAWALDASADAEPSMDIQLKAGDVLYLPGGCSFAREAVASDADTPSACFVLSASVRWTWTKMTQRLVQVVSDKVLSSDPVAGQAAGAGVRELPYTLPLSLLRHAPRLGLSSGDEAGPKPEAYEAQQKEAIKKLSALLRDIARQLESQPEAVMDRVMDEKTADFMFRRLPPHPSMLPETGPEPGLDDFLVGRGDGLFAILPAMQDEDGMQDSEDEGNDEQGERGLVILGTPLHNPRHVHMLNDHPEEQHDDGDESESDSDIEGLDAFEEEEEEQEGQEKKEKDGVQKAPKHVHGPGCGHHHRHHKKGKEEEEDLGSEDESDLGSDSEDEERDSPAQVRGPIMGANYVPAVARVLNCTSAPGVRVRDLIPMLPHKNEEEALNLATMLWHEGFACVLPGAKQAGAKQAGAKRTAEGNQEAKKKKAKGGK